MSDRTNRPDFLIIGAEKAGTTWLYDILRAHPEIYLPDVKELHFFNQWDSNGHFTDRFDGNGLAWYEAQFAAAQKGQLKGEATPLYLSDAHAPGRVRSTLPDARFIVLLRDPVARAWSHFRMARAKDHIREDLDELIATEDDRILGRGLYARHLRRWFAQFPKDRFHILFFETVMAAPGLALQQLAGDYGIDPAPLLAARPDVPRNGAAGYRSARLYNASVMAARGLRAFPPTHGLARGLKASGVYDLIKRANRTGAAPMTLSDAQRAALVAFFADDVAQLRSEHGLSPPWPDWPALPAPNPDIPRLEVTHAT